MQKREVNPIENNLVQGESICISRMGETVLLFGGSKKVEMYSGKSI